jgi:hypothetical protein
MDERGYSLRIVRANEQADPSNIGVLLGRVCIKKEIPVSEVAEFLSVSRMSVYNWFCGKGTPRKRMQLKIKEILEKLGDAQGG